MAGKKSWARWAILVVALLAVGGGVAAALRAPVVDVETVSRGPVVQTLVVSGRVLAPAEIELGTPVVARVEAVLADVGDRVTEGQVLLNLDAAEAQAAVQEAEANERRATAGIRQLRRVTSSIAGDDLESARVRLQEAEEELARVRTLLRSGAIPRTRLDESVRARDLAQTQLASSATRLSSSRPGGAEAALAAAQLAQAEAALVAARARLSQMEVRAPVAGVVLHRQTEPGSVVSPGQALVTLLADGQARLVVEPDESHLSLLTVGGEALASADAFPDDRFAATVQWIAPAIDAERGTVEVRLSVDEPPEYLRADMTVSVDIEVGRADSALVVPATAVQDAATAQPFVLIVADGRVAKRDVTLGLLGSEHYEVESGLEEGDSVITGDGLRLEPGDRVRMQGGGES